MTPHRIDDTLSVSPQIAPSDIAELRAAGYRSVICNRPDGEGTDQFEFEEIEAAAREAGLEARYLPVQSGRVTDADASAFAAALRELPGPTLAYCRSGTRSATLWSLTAAARLSCRRYPRGDRRMPVTTCPVSYAASRPAGARPRTTPMRGMRS
ncbi:MAG: TIGR01244 family sulfur transferase [Halofilum sp. (in: g-proteobacteria)]|nr:TIGR01244 family sulfur transferase [Halofilum sp. (in: g-proteobacteria)]